jgi:hypothetical protein
MYYTGITGGTPTVAKLQEELDNLLAKTVAPEKLTYFVTEVEELRGQIAALTEINEDFISIADAAVENGWGSEQRIVRRLQALLRTAERAAGKSLQFSDDSSGRNNDNRRSFRDGWFNIIEAVRRDLDREIRELYS